MFQTGVMLGLYKLPFWLAQQTVDPTVNTPEQAAYIFSGPRFFIALIAGVILAFAFQFVITNLGLAVLISNAGGHSDSHDRSDGESDSLGETINKISQKVGIATLISVTLSLFLACFLAVKLGLLTATASAGLGAIIGLVIWAAYFLLLVWVSSTAVGSVVGSVINTATAGFQAIFGTAAAAIGGQAASKQVVATAEAAAAAVRREFGSGIDPVTIRETVEDYIQALKPPELDISRIRTEFEGLLNDPNFKAIANSDNLANVDRKTFEDLIANRTDLSKRDRERILDQLEGVWKQTVGQMPKTNSVGDTIDALRSAAPAEFTKKIDQLIAQMRSDNKSDDKEEQPTVSPVTQAMTLGMNSLMGMVMGRTDLSDFDVEKILNQLKSVKNTAQDQGMKVIQQVGGDPTGTPFSTIRADIENYLLNTYSWQMNQATLERDFRDVLYDPAADPAAVHRDLEQINRSDFVDLLSQRGVFTQAKINEIADTLESIRLEVLGVAAAAIAREKAMDVLLQVESYILTTPKEDFTPEKIQLNFKPILEDSDADYTELSSRLAQFDSSTFSRLLNQREDFTPVETDPVVTELDRARSRVLAESQEIQEAIKAKAEAQWLKVQSYLRDTGKAELNPQAIQRDLQLLLDDPQAGASAIRTRLSYFDRDTLVKLLTARNDLDEGQVNQVLDQVQGTWTRVRYAPEKLAGKAKEQYDSVTTTIADYLRNTGKDELNPEGIQRDLARLFDNPQAGAYALRQRLSQVDRDTLVKLLSQRQDLSEEQVNQTIDQVQANLRSIAKAPRRLAARTQARVQDFQATLEDYLRNTGKDELNPEGIKRDLQLLLNDPRVGASNLGSRLSSIDRSTLISLLSQRQDMTEEEAARVVDNVLSVRDQVIAQIQGIQAQIQSVIDSIFDRIRNYLNSLDRPELNYEGITTDLRKVFDDPQAGFDALRDRFSQVDRGTLVALLSSREDISEADANRLIDQVEGTRTRILQRAERLQMETQRRVEDVKRQAAKQADDTRKAAASAAWWLFLTAIVSAVASALAGALAVAGP